MRTSNMRRIVIALTTSLFLAKCVTARGGCGLDVATIAALRQLLASDWNDVSASRVSEIWPAKMPWGGRSSPLERCDGTTTLSDLEDVHDNACRCCDTFAFDQRRRPPNCEELLSSITIVRLAVSRREATQLAAILMNAASAEKERDGAATNLWTHVRPIDSTTTETASVELHQVRDGWRVQFLAYRSPATAQAADTTRR